MKSLPILILLVICASIAIAEEMTTVQTEYLLGETVQAETDMQDFLLSKLSLEDNQSNKVQMGFLSNSLEEKEFIYFNIPITLPPGEYTLKAKDQRVIDEVLQDYEISTTFTVKPELGISINPPIVFLDETKTEIKIALTNNAEEAISVNVSVSDENLKPIRKVIDIGSKATKNAFIQYVFDDITIGQEIIIDYLERGYTLKVIVPEIVEEPIVEEPVIDPVIDLVIEELKFQATNVDKKTSKHTSYSDPLIITNTFKTEQNVEFELTGNLAEVVELKISSTEAQAGEDIEQYLWVNKEKNANPGTYEGDLILAAGEYSEQIHLKFTFEELTIIEENVTKEIPLFNRSKFNQTTLSNLLNETKVTEEPNVKKNVTIALIMLAIVILIVIIAASKLQKKVQKKEFVEYVHKVRKGRK